MYTEYSIIVIYVSNEYNYNYNYYIFLKSIENYIQF